VDMMGASIRPPRGHAKVARGVPASGRRTVPGRAPGGYATPGADARGGAGPFRRTSVQVGSPARLAGASLGLDSLLSLDSAPARRHDAMIVSFAGIRHA
jgi:hypothetical protein